jgi:hypothetical protein
MARDRDRPQPALKDLAPPPRAVPLRLWCHLLAGRLTVGGSAAFAFGMVFVFVFLPATDPIGTWRLAHRRQAAPGWLEGVQETSFHEGGDDDSESTPIYRCDYTFLLPDGTPLRGRSYTVGPRFQLPPPAPNRAAVRVAVTVEYDPEHPDTNRIEGTRTSPYPVEVGLVGLVSAVGLLVAGAGLMAGRRRVRLLRGGEVAEATVTTCPFGAGDAVTDLPVAEYKQRLACLSAAVGGHPYFAFAAGFYPVWNALVGLFTVAGAVFCVAVLVMVLFGFPTPPAEKGLLAMGFAGFLVLWLTVGGSMMETGRQRSRVAGRRGQLPAVPPVITCGFEFRLPDGAVVQARAPGRLAAMTGPEPPQPALYDPARPGRAVLVSGLEPAAEVGLDGAWETTAGAGAGGRLLVALLLLAAPVFVWALRL